MDSVRNFCSNYARSPEIREFLRGRNTVIYPEAWMGAVDAMNKIQHWTDVCASLSGLNDFGEQIILSIGHYRWDTEKEADEAKARWKLSSRRFKHISSHTGMFVALTLPLLNTVLTRGSEKITSPSFGGKARNKQYSYGEDLHCKNRSVEKN
jgi:hypothetical protein